MSYTNTFNVLNDLDIASKLSRRNFTLANFQPIAENRWLWIYQNWASLNLRFQKISAGNEDLQAKYDQFVNFIDSYTLGNRVNPFASAVNFINAASLLDLIPLSELSLTPDESSFRDKEASRVAAFQINDYQSMIDFLRKEEAVIAQALGMGDDDAKKLTGVGTGTKQREPTIQDLIFINQYDLIIQYIQSIIINLQAAVGRPPNVLKETQKATNVALVTNYVSSTTRPFEISLEHMAKRYMGTPDRWMELITVNNLQTPFVDESGTKFTLLAPAGSNSAVIPDDLKDSVGVGVKIKIGSHKYAEEARIIEKIVFNKNSNSMVFFLSGDQNLTKFKPAEGGYIRIYKPQTTRRGEFLIIPSTSVSKFSSSIKTPSSDELRRLDAALLNFGVDLYINDITDDIEFAPDGSFKLAGGTVNVKQAALNALRTVRGELPWHSAYGVNANVGGRFFGTNDELLIFGQLLRNTLLRDPRYQKVLISQLKTTGTGISIGLQVTIAGTDQAIPLAFIS